MHRTIGELQALRDLGIDLMQGYFIARPAFEALAVSSMRVPARRLKTTKSFWSEAWNNLH